MRNQPITQTSPDLVGKFINRYLWTDAYPVGKIVGIKSKTIVYVSPVTTSKNKTKMEVLVGGFAGHTVNNREQSYDYEVDESEVFEFRLSKKSHKNGYKISDKPYYFYDYNF